MNPSVLSADRSAAAAEHEFNVRCSTSPIEPSADERQFPRSEYRTSLQAVVFRPPGDPGHDPDAGTRCQLLTRDISRSGMNLLYKQQLFPGQKIDVLFTDGHERRLVVIWCRRLGAGSYSAGCRFVKAE